MKPGLLDWLRSEDTQRYDQLVNEIKAGHCSVFIGAGLSRPAGYPSWPELIEDLANAAGVDVFKDQIGVGSRRLIEVAERCRETMGSTRYRKFLEQEFHPTIEKDPSRTIHLDLLETPFNAYLTTNFDSCLENAAERVPDVSQIHVHPILEAAHLRSRHIYHLHGKAYDGDRSIVDTIVLTASDYEHAYTARSGIRSLIRELFVHQAVLFIGFRLTDPESRFTPSDPAFDQVLKFAWEDYQALSEDVLHYGLGRFRDKTHWALLPAVSKKDVEQLDAISRPDEETEREEEEFLRTRGISVIRYRGDDLFHSELTKIVRELRDRTASSRLPGVPTLDRSLFVEEEIT